MGKPGVTERVVLPERVPPIGMGLVDGDRRHPQRRFGLPAVRQQKSGAFTVNPETALVVLDEVIRDVQEVSEIGRNFTEDPVGEIDRTGDYTQ
jgi:hypothetical protein